MLFVAFTRRMNFHFQGITAFAESIGLRWIVNTYHKLTSSQQTEEHVGSFHFSSYEAFFPKTVRWVTMQLSHFEGGELYQLISCLNDFKLKWSTALYLIFYRSFDHKVLHISFAEGAAISITLNLANSITISQKIPLASSEISLSIAVSSEKPWTSAS